MKIENDNVVILLANFRPKPFLQTGGVPACALPYALWCVVNKCCDFIHLSIARGAGQDGQSWRHLSNHLLTRYEFT